MEILPYAEMLLLVPGVVSVYFSSKLATGAAFAKYEFSILRALQLMTYTCC